jgi:hypothetical protein
MVTVLPDDTADSNEEVVVTREPPLHKLHELRQRLLAAREDDEVDMIGHNYEGEERCVSF